MMINASKGAISENFKMEKFAFMRKAAIHKLLITIVEEVRIVKECFQFSMKIGSTVLCCFYQQKGKN